MARALSYSPTGNGLGRRLHADDAKIVTALKRGTNAILSARSGRGTLTKDTFSLSGFTAAVEDAEKRCN